MSPRRWLERPVPGCREVCTSKEFHHVERKRRQDAGDDDHRVVAPSELVYGKSRSQVVSRRDGDQPLPRAVRGCAVGLSARAGSRRSRHRHRRRLPVRPGRRRPELDQLPAAPHGRLRRDPSEAGGGERRRHRVSARPHPARLPRSARHAADRRPARARRNAVCGDLEGGAAADAEAGEVRHRHAGTGRLRRAGRALQEPARSDHGDERRLQRGTARPGRRRLPDHPDGRAADSPARRAQVRRQGDQPRVHAEGVQQHRPGACAPRPKSGATPAGATRRSSACSPRCRPTSRRSSC